jgi:hypothetical protein
MRKFKWYLVAYVVLDLLIGYAGVIPLGTAAAAQFTTVTGTVVDPNGFPYALGTITAVLILPGGTSPTLNGLPYTPPTQPTGLDKTGSFTLQLADNTVLLPAATKWNFTVCSAIGTVQPASGKGPVCFVLAAPITISGASQSISTQLNAAALPLTVTSSGAVSAAGAAANQVAYFTSPSAITSSANFTFNGTLGVLGGPESALPADIQGFFGPAQLVTANNVNNATSDGTFGVESYYSSVGLSSTNASGMSSVTEGLQSANGTPPWTVPIVVGAQAIALLDTSTFTSGAAAGYFSQVILNTGTANPQTLTDYLTWPMVNHTAQTPVNATGYYARQVGINGSTETAGFYSEDQGAGNDGFYSNQGATGLAFHAKAGSSSSLANVQASSVTSTGAYLGPNLNSTSSMTYAFSGSNGGMGLNAGSLLLQTPSGSAGSLGTFGGTNALQWDTTHEYMNQPACSSSGNSCLTFATALISATGSENPIIHSTNNSKAVGTSDFTSANSAALQAITGLSFPLGSTAQVFTFHCVLMYSQATNVAGDQFGVGVITTAPTNVNASGAVYTNTGAASPVSTGVLNGLTTTTPTAVVTFQPAVTSVLRAELDGTIETAGGGAATFNPYVLNGTAADVIVVKRGSQCTIN